MDFPPEVVNKGTPRRKIQQVNVCLIKVGAELCGRFAQNSAPADGLICVIRCIEIFRL